MKKKVLILTLNDYIIYQPTILSLYDFMQPHFDVQIVSFKPRSSIKKKDEVRNVIYLKPNFFLKHLFQKTDFFLSHAFRLIKKISPSAEYHYIYYTRYLPYLLRSGIKKHTLGGDIIIAADFPALYEAQGIFDAVHFISLEIENNTSPIHKKVDRNKVRSVLIQSKERYDYLFPGMELPVFYVQNAPVFTDEMITHYERKDFILSGAIDRRLAIYDCLDFFDRYPQYRLYIKGATERKVIKKINEQYLHLLKDDRIKIDQEYMPASSFIDFLSHFRIGFAFYRWDLIRGSFNYATAPSGKLFMNLAAGVPAIASDIPGFKFLEEFNAGVLVDDYLPETIEAATQKIEADYEKYHQGCYNAARYFSFDKRVKPYIEFLLQN